VFLNAKKIGLYWPTDGEVSLVELCSLRNKQFFWPILQERVRPWQGRGLLFARTSGRWRDNRYGIPEPVSRKLFRARDLDCILVPVVGFDEALHRLGMGGGYYDRALANLNPWKPTTLIGVAHELQKVSELAHNTWDIRMDGVVTESGLRFRSQRDSLGEPLD
tara:strand:+ start:696 stop:1184 length:489 start_codon:yes stop_codon:yes gene_type:complete